MTNLIFTKYKVKLHLLGNIKHHRVTVLLNDDNNQLISIKFRALETLRKEKQSRIVEEALFQEQHMKHKFLCDKRFGLVRMTPTQASYKKLFMFQEMLKYAGGPFLYSDDAL